VMIGPGTDSGLEVNLWPAPPLNGETAVSEVITAWPDGGGEEFAPVVESV
jgi:hypothetical protein